MGYVLKSLNLDYIENEALNRRDMFSYSASFESLVSVKNLSSYKGLKVVPWKLPSCAIHFKPIIRWNSVPWTFFNIFLLACINDKYISYVLRINCNVTDKKDGFETQRRDVD